jgi:hypothetical protein
VDSSFWFGAAIGLVTSAAVAGAGWFIPTKVLVPKLEVRDWEAFKDDKGRIRYRFSVYNTGKRDAVDVTVSSTLFSRGWGKTPNNEYATITVPVSVSRIDVIPPAPGPSGPGDRRIDALGARLITLLTDELTDFQLKKLDQADRDNITSGQITLNELFALGVKGPDGKPDSFLNVVLYGVDRYSGARSVITEHPLSYDDIPAVRD